MSSDTMHRVSCAALLFLAGAACSDSNQDNWTSFGADAASESDGENSSDNSASSSANDGSGGSSSSSDEPGGEASSTGVKFDIGNDTQGGDTMGGTPGEGCEFLDILFVVDISLSMHEEHAKLAANFPQFVQVLDAYVDDPAKPANGYRIGVTNSSIVDNGADGLSTAGLDGSLVATGKYGADCGNDGQRWLDGPAPGLPEVFTCLADSPYADCTADTCSDRGKERPLDAIGMFIDKHANGGDNEGFYRGDTSLLVIVNLTDEDDDPAFSASTPAGSNAKIESFVGGAQRYVLVTIAGLADDICCTPMSGGCAFPAPRLHEFTGLAEHGLMGDVCQADLAQPLADALELIQGSCDVLPPPAG